MNSRSPRISVIIPTLDEEAWIGSLLDHLSELGADEIIVADGGSRDGTLGVASGRARVVTGPSNRGSQMNAGAKAASGDLLLFLHADVRLGPDAMARLRELAERAEIAGGNFDIRYQGGDAAARVFTRINRWRRRFGVFYGDSGIFCRRTVFEKLRGFRPYPVLEDYEFARRLWHYGKLALLEDPIYVSDRRWKHSSLPGTLWSWFWIQGLYLCGVSPQRLARMYRSVR